MKYCKVDGNRCREKLCLKYVKQTIEDACCKMYMEGNKNVKGTAECRSTANESMDWKNCYEEVNEGNYTHGQEY